MRNYEVTFIVDPVLSGDEIKAAAQTYIDLLKKEGAEIVYIDEMGLRQLAYAINRRTSGVYYTVEFKIPTGEFIEKIELSMRRDERIMRFLTVKLDKYGVKYNEDKRNGLIGKKKKTKEAKETAGAKKAEKQKVVGAKKEAKVARKVAAPAAPVVPAGGVLEEEE